MPQVVSIIIKSVFTLTGLLCIVFSYLIGVKGKTTLIAGYDPSKVKDEKGLSRFFGILTFILGLFTIVYPFACRPDGERPLIWLLYYTVPVIIITLVMIFGSSRYESKQGE